MNKATNTEFSGSFQNGISRSGKTKDAGGGSDQQNIAMSDLIDGAKGGLGAGVSTVSPLQKGGVEVHYETDATGRPSIPVTKNPMMQPVMVPSGTGSGMR